MRYSKINFISGDITVKLKIPMLILTEPLEIIGFGINYYIRFIKYYVSYFRTH